MEALLILGLIGIFLIMLWIAWATAQYGRKRYSLRLILSWNYVLNVAAAVLLLIGLANTGTANGMVLYSASVILAAVALIRNIAGSSLLFGIWFNLVQLLATSLVPLTLLLVGAARNDQSR